MVADSEPTPYERIGGETGVRALTDLFYDIMDSDERDQWMACMRAALAQQVLDRELCEWLGSVFLQMASHLRNRRD